VSPDAEAVVQPATTSFRNIIINAVVHPHVVDVVAPVHQASDVKRNVFASQQLVLDPGLLPTASHRLSRSEPTSPLVRASTER